MVKEKKEVIIPIKGLNNRDKGYKLEDGYCVRLHNVAYRNGSWRKVRKFPKIAVFDEAGNVDEYRVAYKHTILGADEFIAYYYVENHHLYRISRVRITGGEIVELQKIIEITNKPEREAFTFSHYGSMLILSYKDSLDSLHECNFVFYEGAYVRFEISEIIPVSNPWVDYTISTIPFDGNAIPAPKVAAVTAREESVGSSTQIIIDTFDPTYQEIYSQFNTQGFIHGALYAFAAYKLYDGTVVRNGDVFMLNPDIKKADDGEYLYRYANGNQYEYYLDLKGFKPHFEIDSRCIASVNSLPFVESIVLYATPCNQIYEIDAVFEKFTMDHPKFTSFVKNGKTFDSIRADVILDKRNFDVMNKPFYAVAEIDFRNGFNGVVLDYNTHFRGIESKPIYSPNYSVHNIFSRGIFDFNGYLHRFSLVTNFFKGSQSMIDMNTVYFGSDRYTKVMDAVGVNLKFIYTLNIDGRDVFVSCEQRSFSYQLQNGSISLRYLILPNMITYPDARARKLSIVVVDNSGKAHMVKEFELKSAISNNYAYFQDVAAERVIGYNIIERSTTLLMSTALPNLNKTILQPNKMIVSVVGNPSVFRPINTYSIGDGYNTEIIDVNIPVDDVSDTSFGNYPIYVFTTMGIYAMERGTQEKIYSTEVLVNGDNIKTKTTTLAIAGQLFYLTNAGVTVLNARNGVLISGILDGERGVPGITFEEYIIGARLMVIDSYRELVVFNKLHDYAYIYSIEGKAWCTREMRGDYIGGSLLVYNGDVIDLSGVELGLQLHADIETHDIHLEKGIRKVVEEMEFDTSGGYNISVSGLSGSLNRVLRHGFMQRIFYRLQRSWLCFRVSLTGDIDYLNAVRIKYRTRYK